MSKILDQIKNLVAKGEVRISDHGYDELAADAIFARDVVAGIPAAEMVEDYPDFSKGPCVLVLEHEWNCHFPLLMFKVVLIKVVGLVCTKGSGSAGRSGTEKTMCGVSLSIATCTTLL